MTSTHFHQPTGYAKPEAKSGWMANLIDATTQVWRTYFGHPKSDYVAVSHLETHAPATAWDGAVDHIARNQPHALVHIIR